jgi:hypothetical protein
VGFKHLVLFEAFEVAEHQMFFHMVSVDDAVRVREIAGVGGIEKVTRKKDPLLRVWAPKNKNDNSIFCGKVDN